MDTGSARTPIGERTRKFPVAILARERKYRSGGDHLVGIAPFVHIYKAVAAYDEHAVAVLLRQSGQHILAVMHFPVLALGRVHDRVRQLRGGEPEHRLSVGEIGGTTFVGRVARRDEYHPVASQFQRPCRHLYMRVVRRIERASEQRRAV